MPGACKSLWLMPRDSSAVTGSDSGNSPGCGVLLLTRASDALCANEAECASAFVDVICFSSEASACEQQQQRQQQQFPISLYKTQVMPSDYLMNHAKINR